MERVFQEFPMMIYHSVEKPVIVKDKSELDGYLAKGWRKEPYQFSKMERLEREINWHEEETLRLKGELAMLKEDMKIPEGQPPAPLVESKPDEFFEDDVPTVTVPISSLVKGQGHDELIPPVPEPVQVPPEVPTKAPSRRIRK
jgi:hypothetical protein